MADITVTPWGFDHFDGMSNNWLARVCAQALEYREDDDFDTLAGALRELRDPSNSIWTGRDYIEFEAYGNTYYLCTESLYERMCEDAIDNHIEDAEYELERGLQHIGWLNPYITIDRDMLARDLSYDKEYLIDTYDGRVDELYVAWIREDGKVHRSDQTWYLWRTN